MLEMSANAEINAWIRARVAWFISTSLFSKNTKRFLVHLHQPVNLRIRKAAAVELQPPL
jgi:hypothetical protein